MKIQTILSEDFTPDAAGGEGRGALPALPPVRYSDLSTADIRTLLRVADGKIDIETATESEFDSLTDLQERGLLDDDFALTGIGASAVKKAQEVGGSAEVVRAKRRQSKLDSGAADKFDLPPVEGEEEFEFEIDDETPPVRF